jgi:RHS repeat-associated protein
LLEPRKSICDTRAANEDCINGGSRTRTKFGYDVLNRLTTVTRPISSTNSNPQSITYAYAGRKRVVSDPYSHTNTIVKDVNGKLRQTTDALGYTITRTYDAANSLTGVTDSVGNTLLSGVTYKYGIKPFRVADADADRGAWTYTIDSLGERTGWTDAKGQSFSMTYDSLSRPLTRTEPDLFSQWTYGSTPASHNVGQLVSECSNTTGSCGSTPIYTETRTFDSDARLSTRSIKDSALAGNNTGGVFLFTYGYSSTTGLPSSLTYPISTSGVALNLSYAYQYGLLQSVTDTTDTTTTCGKSCTLWTANSVNAFGEVTNETLGNGVVTNRTYDAVTSWLSAATAGVGGGATLLNQSYTEDENGNVTQRQNNNLGLTENLFYDADNRLLCATLASSCSTNTFAYDAGSAGPGNITTQTGVGTYTYPAPGQPRPHAVTSLTGTFNGIVNPTFAYDANGNMTNRASASANITWTSFNYPMSISATDATGSETVAINYGPDRQRVQQNYTGPSGTESTFYIGGLMDIVIQGGTTNYRHYINASSEPIAVYSRTAAGVNTMSYMLEDHQGSISTITSMAGAVDVNESFSAFGARRSPTTWSGAPTTADLNTIASLSRQGYTFQTWLGQSMGLNHMNGRVEDAILGRFLSPDPYVPDPSNAQSYNRYSYVNNNPMSMVDPSGFNATSVCATQGICWSDFALHAGPQAGGGAGPVFGDDYFGENQFGPTGGDFDGGYYSLYVASPSDGSTGAGGSNGEGVPSSSTAPGTATTGDTSESAQSQASSDGLAELTVTAQRNSFNDPLIFDPTTAVSQYLQAANRGSAGFWSYTTNPDNPYHATAPFRAQFDGSPLELAVTSTMLMIQLGSYPLRETLTGADLQLPGGAGAFYDVYTVGPPDAPLPGQRIVNVSGSNVFYYSPYHYNPGPGVPNGYVQFTLAPGACTTQACSW